MEKDTKIIIVDDDPKIIEVLKAKLKNYTVEGFTDANQAIGKIKEDKFDLLILDYLLIGINGEEVVKKIREFNKNLYIFLLTGCDREMLKPMKTLQGMDIQFYCEKSVDIENVLLNIENAIKSIVFLRDKQPTFSLRLKQLRKNRKVGQDELARYLGVGRTAVANWESGLTEPSAEKLKKIATFFQVTIDYLLCHELNIS